MSMLAVTVSPSLKLPETTLPVCIYLPPLFFCCLFYTSSVGRSGSKWMEGVCRALDIPTKSNRVDLGVRVELPAVVFSHLTDELYESKIVYRTEKVEDNVRTFCMNPHGIVVNENTNGIVTVNGHSYEDAAMQTCLLYTSSFFLLTKPSTRSMSCGAISSTRSSVAVAGTATGTMRVCPSLMTRNATGSIFTPAPPPPPKLSLIHIFGVTWIIATSTLALPSR